MRIYLNEIPAVTRAVQAAREQLSYHQEMIGKNKMVKIESLQGLKDFTGIVLFSADWCAPCKGYKPVLEQFCKGMGLRLALVDVEAARALAGTFGVRSVPTTYYFVNGSPSRVRTGAMTEAALAAFVGK